jgi:hypothetical protein
VAGAAGHRAFLDHYGDSGFGCAGNLEDPLSRCL